MAFLQLKPGREKALLRHHPWVFSGAVARAPGSPEDGDTVEIQTSDGDFLAWGAYSSRSQIRSRIWSWDKAERIDESFFRRRLAAAMTSRQTLLSLDQTNALRVVHAESDGLPGLIVDRYDEVLVAQFLSYGAERWRDVITELLQEVLGVRSIYERSDVEVRGLEGLQERTGLIAGQPIAEKVRIEESGLSYWVDIQHGHKTGFYLDQRANRERLRDYASNRDVLDCFSYTGGFTVAALAGGARSVLTVDSSAVALDYARENLKLNELPSENAEFLEGDVFKLLREFRDRARSFDMIVLDPPKFAPTTAQAQRAARGYKDINLLAFKLLRPGGILFTFSCSGGIDMPLFQKIVAGAALDAGVQAQILERLYQDLDHPVALNFPEGEYLKGLVLRVE